MVLRTKSYLFVTAHRLCPAICQSPWCAPTTALPPRVNSFSSSNGPACSSLRAFANLVPQPRKALAELPPLSLLGLHTPQRGPPQHPVQSRASAHPFLNILFFPLGGPVVISLELPFPLCFKELSPKRALTLSHSPGSSLKSIS